jgi:ribonuclease P protein component
MLKKENRLVKKVEIDGILKAKKKVYFKNIQIKLAKNNVSKFRSLVVVSKKISKRAVKRNRIRRIFNSFFVKLQGDGRLPSGIDVMILIKNKDILVEKVWDFYFEKVVEIITAPLLGNTPPKQEFRQSYDYNKKLKIVPGK